MEKEELIQLHGNQLLKDKDGLLREAKLHADISIEYASQQLEPYKKKCEELENFRVMYMSTELELIKLQKDKEELLEGLDEARLQIEYLHGKFQKTGTSESVLSRLSELVAKHRKG